MPSKFLNFNRRWNCLEVKNKFSFFLQVYEKQCRNLEETAVDAKAKHDDHEKNLNEANAKKARMASEINELKRILEEKEALNGQMTRSKNSMQQSNEEIKRQLEEEVKGKNALQHQVQAAIPTQALPPPIIKYTPYKMQ